MAHTASLLPTHASPDDEARWAAILARDPRADETFVYAVRTTGVYCRPSCPSRLARRENVRFFANCTAAVAAGFRACKRCQPDRAPPRAAQLAAIAAACRLLEESETPPSLAALAASAGLSRFHFHRVFKACTGVTPKAYAAQARDDRLRRELARGTSVTVACYEAGFNSSSSFYQAARGALGMQPREYRRGGAALAIHHAYGNTSLGRILVAATAQGLCAILFGEDDDSLLADLRARFPNATLQAAAPDFAATVTAVARLVETPARGLALPLDIRGTAFQQRVWRALRELPAGATISYGELAGRIDAPAASRAVAQACGANPLAVAVPCHRVVRGNGDLAGYRWGVTRKRELLAREAGRDEGS